MFSFFKKFLQKDTSKSQHIPKEKSLSDYNITMSIYTPLEIDSIYQKPMECGLLPGEIVLLGWLDNKSATREYPRYYSSTYDIDAFKKTQKLIEEGYIRGASPKEGLQSLRSIDLSKILERNRIKKTGKKQDLIDRICNSLTLEEIEECIESKVYAVTDKGKSTLEKHYYILFAHQHRVNLYSVSEAISFMQNRVDQPSNLEIGISVLKSRLRENLENRDYGLARNCFLSLARLSDIHKQDNEAVFFYLCMFIFDVSGWTNGDDYHENNILGEHCATIAPRLINDKIDINNLQQEFDKAWHQIGKNFPKHYLGEKKPMSV